MRLKGQGGEAEGGDGGVEWADGSGFYRWSWFGGQSPPPCLSASDTLGLNPTASRSPVSTSTHTEDFHSGRERQRGRERERGGGGGGG